MKKQLAFILFLIVALAVVCGQSYAAKVGTFGIPVSDTAPLEVDSDGVLTVNDDLTIVSGTFTSNSDLTVAGALDISGNIDTDAGIYANEMVIDSAYTVDPCGTLDSNAIFFTSGGNAEICFCNSLGVDLSLYDGSTACF